MYAIIKCSAKKVVVLHACTNIVAALFGCWLTWLSLLALHTTAEQALESAMYMYVQGI